MRVVEIQEEDYEDDTVGVTHWRVPREEMLEIVDDQLEAFGLEVVVIDAESSDIMWRIERRSRLVKR